MANFELTVELACPTCKIDYYGFCMCNAKSRIRTFQVFWFLTLNFIKSQCEIIRFASAEINFCCICKKYFWNGLFSQTKQKPDSGGLQQWKENAVFQRRPNRNCGTMGPTAKLGKHPKAFGNCCKFVFITGCQLNAILRSFSAASLWKLKKLTRWNDAKLTSPTD